MAITTNIRFDIPGIITNVRKKSKVYIDEHSNEIFSNLKDVVEQGKNWITRTFLSAPFVPFTNGKDYVHNTTPYPRRNTGSLIRSLSFRMVKNPIQYGYRRTNQVQFTITPVWRHNPQPDTDKGDYPELLNSGVIPRGARKGQPYHQNGFKDKVKMHLIEYLNGRFA